MIHHPPVFGVLLTKTTPIQMVTFHSAKRSSGMVPTEPTISALTCPAKRGWGSLNKMASVSNMATLNPKWLMILMMARRSIITFSKGWENSAEGRKRKDGETKMELNPLSISNLWVA